MNTYSTSEIAQAIGIHPNTVRLYEELELIPKPERRSNGYRVFTDYHMEQFKLARLAFKVEVVQNGLRKKIVQMVKKSASGDFDAALVLTKEYLAQVRQERANAEEVILGLLSKLSEDSDVDIEAALNTPGEDEEDVIAVCDRLIISLSKAEDNAEK